MDVDLTQYDDDPAVRGFLESDRFMDDGEDIEFQDQEEELE